MVNLIIITTSAAAGILSYQLSNRFNKGPVFGSAVVTLASGILFPLLIPEMADKLMVAAACASYAGMAAKKLVPTTIEIGLISALSGIILILATNSYAGIGGRLGTIAALSCFAWIGLKKQLDKVTSLENERIDLPKIGVWE